VHHICQCLIYLESLTCVLWVFVLYKLSHLDTIVVNGGLKCYACCSTVATIVAGAHHVGRHLSEWRHKQRLGIDVAHKIARRGLFTFAQRRDKLR
tara:strand:+ start:438 stop:722 length:285 start_codon:yes stop_codon:yes gene_type:complete